MRLTNFLKNFWFFILSMLFHFSARVANLQALAGLKSDTWKPALRKKGGLTARFRGNKLKAYVPQGRSMPLLLVI